MKDENDELKKINEENNEILEGIKIFANKRVSQNIY